MSATPTEVEPNRVTVIGEIGVNHNGSILIAEKLIDVAADAGVDIVKFQTFDPAEIVTDWSPSASYQRKATEKATQQEILKSLVLSKSDLKTLKGHCEKKGVEFLSTAFDVDNLNFLVELGIKRIKIPSGEITNRDLLVHAASFELPIILSTGMSTLEEVSEAIEVLVQFGSRLDDLTLLHCTSAYPAPLRDVNLRAMTTMGLELGISVGYSDHTSGIDVAVAAVAMGASIVEKHFTLDRSMDGPDHKASLEPSDLKEMVDKIRSVTTALGSPSKHCTQSESEVRIVARRSLVARQRILRGEVLTREMLTAKRPGTGISPMEIDRVVGTRAIRDFDPDELIET